MRNNQPEWRLKGMFLS